MRLATAAESCARAKRHRPRFAPRDRRAAASSGRSARPACSYARRHQWGGVVGRSPTHPATAPDRVPRPGRPRSRRPAQDRSARRRSPKALVRSPSSVGKRRSIRRDKEPAIARCDGPRSHATTPPDRSRRVSMPSPPPTPGGRQRRAVPVPTGGRRPAIASTSNTRPLPPR